MNIPIPKYLKIFLGAGFVLLLAGFIFATTLRTIQQNNTASYRQEALEAIKQRTNDPQWVPSKLADMQNRPNDDAWLSEHLILAKNGEWLAYCSTCSKTNWKIRDIFLCRASDNNWYDSTYHFCVHAIVLRADGQPDSLQAFIDQYGLHKLEATSKQTHR